MILIGTSFVYIEGIVPVDNDKIFNDYVEEGDVKEFFDEDINRKIGVRSFESFSKKYYESNLGSKFSERVFCKWIASEFELYDMFCVKTHHCKGKIIINDVVKNFDFAINTNKNKYIFEFKCNIDMIEKDLFKLMHLEQDAMKIMFIWEKFDNSKNSSGEKSSYKKILEYAKENEWICDYFYFPITDKKTNETSGLLAEEIEKFKLFIRKNEK